MRTPALKVELFAKTCVIGGSNRSRDTGAGLELFCVIIPVIKTAFSDLSRLGSISRAIGDMLSQFYDARHLPEIKAHQKILRRLDKQENASGPERH